MDHEGIDRLSRIVAKRLNRRTLTVFTGLSLAALAAGPAGLEAKKKKKKKCKGGLTRCTVKKGKKKKATCVNVQSNNAHCGGCGHACPTGQTCKSGACTDGSCTPDPKGVTCESKCGSVVNNCGQTVHCGACGCLPVTTTSELQAACDAVDPGETLTLCAGTWNITATVSIGDDMTLKGSGVGQTILDGSDSVRVLQIEEDAVVDLEDLTIKRGFATGVENFGAGIRNDGELSLRRVEITKCRADRGGGLFTNGTLDLYAGVQITENHANSDGGGMYAWNESETTMHDDSHIRGNTASHGGGVGLFGCPFTMGSGSRISGNEGTSDVGGILSLSATIVLQDGSVIGGSTPQDGNQGGAYGGGIYASGGSVTLESGSKVIGNAATIGGGIHTSYGKVTARDNSRVSANRADTNGGGISSFGGTIILEAGSVVGGTTLTDGNQCGSSGGGVYASGGSVMVESGSKIIGNSAASGGGIAAGFGTVTVRNGSRVTGNVATTAGGGVFALSETLTVESGVLLCDNLPANSQCSGPFGGVCPQPATGICPG